MNPFKYIVTINGEAVEMSPTAVRGMQETYTLNEEDKRLAFISELNVNLIFLGADYQALHALLQDKCRYVPLEIQHLCGTAYVTWRQCTLRMLDGAWNEDDCTVTIKPRLNNEYTCYEDKSETEENLLALPVQKRTVKYVRGTFEYVQYTRDQYLRDDPAAFGGVDPNTIGYKPYEITGTLTIITPGVRRPGPSDSTVSYTFNYAREVYSGPNPGAGWVLLSDGRYARKPVLTGYTKLYFNNQTPEAGNAPVRWQPELFTSTIFGEDPADVFDDGMLLNDLLSYFANEYCGYAVTSIFLGLNPDADFLTTYPNFQAGLTFYHMVYQKSDVKRPTDDNATKLPYTFKKLLTDVCNLYNLDWRIQDGAFRIEHISYFERAQTLDLTVNPRKKEVVRTRKYSFKTEDIPQKETFKFMEAGTDDFIGRPIEYKSNCVSPDQKEKPLTLDKLTTDVEYCLQNPDGKNSPVSDEGLVVMACTLEGDSFYVLSVDPILETEVHINNCMGWAFLLKLYYPYRRPLIDGYINNRYQAFYSVKPIKKRNRIKIKFCCDDVINLTGLVHTDMGDAEIDAGAYNPYKDQLELDLVYADATPAPPPCLAPTVFRVLYRIGYVWVIETQFDPAGTYRTITEVMFPDGHVESFSKDGDTDGVFAYSIVNISASDTGTYKLRKKIDGPDCAWTAWLEYSRATVTPTVGPCDVGLPEPSLVNKSNYQQLQFRFLGVEVAEDIQVEITVPGNTAHDPVPVRQKTIFSGGTDVIVNILDGMTLEEQAKAQILGTIAGTYRFRFRKQCDPTTYSPWTNYIDVPLP